jgi:hypothetical protein
MSKPESVSVTDLDTLRTEVKRLSSMAIQAKMDLHDLSEELPKDWQTIPAVAARTYEIYQQLTLKRSALKATGA